MKNKRRFFFRLGAVLVLAAVAAVMMVIGRGHTVYFDNKTITVDGQEYPAFQRAEVYVNGERVARLAKKERGLATCMGQSITFSLEITEKKGDEPKHVDATIRLPYAVDGTVVSLPAYMAGLPEEAWRSVFVPQVQQEEPEDETPGADEFDMGGEF